MQKEPLPPFHAFPPFPFKTLALFKTSVDVSIHSRPIRRLTEAADGEGLCGLPLPSGRAAEKDFIGFAVLPTPLFPLKGEVSNHKGILDELLKRPCLHRQGGSGRAAQGHTEDRQAAKELPLQCRIAMRRGAAPYAA